MEIKQNEKYIGNDWWKWSVWLEGLEAQKVKAVTWKLHPSFPEPEKVVDDPSTNFRLDAGGWGAFVVKADVHLNDGTTRQLEHELELHYPDGITTDK